MEISIIAAVAQNLAIGKDNQLLWHLPEDMKFFKEKTTGHHILTGRKNYESIPKKFRPLSQRTNIVVTRQTNYPEEGVHVVNSVEEGLELARKNGETELFVIGGGEIYKQTIHLADNLYITHVLQNFEADTFFPAFKVEDYRVVKRQFYPQDAQHAYDFVITHYKRK